MTTPTDNSINKQSVPPPPSNVLNDNTTHPADLLFQDRVKDSNTIDPPINEVDTHDIAVSTPLPNKLHAIDRDNPAVLGGLFPQTESAIKQQAEAVKKHVESSIQAILAIPSAQRTFDNTVKALDNTEAYAEHLAGAISIIQMVHPDEVIRDAAQAAEKELSSYLIERFSANRELYQAFKEYCEGNGRIETLSPEKKYYIEQAHKAYKRAGFELSTDDFNRATELKQEISSLCTDFGANIAKHKGYARVKEDGLAGIPEKVVAQLQKENDEYILTTDYNILIPVLSECSVESTRKALYDARSNQAAEQNLPILKQIINKRDELAKLLGYESYAHYDLDNSMAEDPRIAKSFVSSVVNAASAKGQKVIQELMRNPPASVTATAEGKVKPWDLSYLLDQYKKEHLAVDETAISEYFPMEATIQGLFSVYNKFFGINFRQVEIDGLWHEDASVIELARDGQVLGHVVVDLYPREGKYSHACHCTLIPSQKGDNGNDQPSVSVVIANFDKASDDKPSLLRLSEVKTFFHEFGHAIHAVLGRTELAGHAGTSVKRDFVEMPSQILEEWLWEPEILNLVSGHYESGEKLPEELIQAKINARKFDFSLFVLRQMVYASMSLDFFGPGTDKDTSSMANRIMGEIQPYIAEDPNSHREANFGHLSGYGAKYYGYMWADTLASVIFASIQSRKGLLDESVGRDYESKVIGKGGSADPKELVADFLGEPFTDDAINRWLKGFCEHMGL